MAEEVRIGTINKNVGESVFWVGELFHKLKSIPVK
jgi:hypothetical protein